MAYPILLAALPGPTLQHFLERSLADPASVKRQALAYLNLCMGMAQQSDEGAAWAGARASVIATLTFPDSLVLTCLHLLHCTNMTSLKLCNDISLRDNKNVFVIQCCILLMICSSQHLIRDKEPRLPRPVTLQWPQSTSTYWVSCTLKSTGYIIIMIPIELAFCWGYSPLDTAMKFKGLNV